MEFKKSQKLYKKGLVNLVGAVNSPVRAFSSVGGNPLFIKKAKGSQITDVDNNTYVDLVLSYGPMILGHRHEKVEKAIKKALKNGYSFGASTENEIKLAKIVCDAFPGMDKVRFVNSGTEAVLSGIRLARAFTGKDKIIKFSGCYHGHQDALLVAAGSGLATLSLPGSKGVPEGAVKNTLIATYNDLESVKAHFEEHDDIAGVILEPIAGNMGVVLPSDNFLTDLKTYLESKGALLIVDEVMTGFRSKFGGAQELLGVEADITCLGKVIGGGFPVGAYGARNEIMQEVSPLGGMYQAGTLSGNPIAMAGGIATLTELKRQNPYDKFNETAQAIETFLLNSAQKYGVEITVNRFGSMVNPFFTNVTVTNFEQAQTSDTNKFATFFWAMIKNGVFLPPSQFESWFLSSALTKKDMKKVSKAIDKAMEAVSKI
ncbi:glutamate-1-semialdehyde 2,1-aminomutase [Tenacibaculum finnmarkense genomovar finnmarkense]|uniref:Glutamate-1-semialdehyde 2,1-aminomutase n=2 Tax=Tenacibaculum finnmarkense TaxID=2781243 RepID=A0AAP1RFT0_9FLAO|nr:glutamate-1-semialdehyde 2,1-aminomutase [Tenacibaculum finnmarkense]MBE7652866.1 glutamate-1-semialdehyde 2,1-aminomutase [Tenacibaculum finnmarkense genomovar finnmarkense]MBE7695088.1 glutamate-1-semialdehyde 2,1-aminomutase [Tenacibaculum finnmarkense genomovar finnmarkense]MCD8417408.1 glutamate-1-semialdehyde 2,1-aminomutase [Tenacibaculum finnmarkense genomovar finnmarkense]MCG8185698.1 glutamate-1-semialdehyde 2,1-aminomutase [Tenacibaculum finnmarkense genomovar finnmarkense]MCG820